MNIGVIGLGKLGLPVSVALSMQHKVIGHDINPELMSKRQYPHRELGPILNNDFQRYFDKADLTFATTEQLAAQCDIIFVAVQTPHQPQFEGVTRIPDERADFDYTHLINAITDLAQFTKPHQIVVVISTVLPGTLRKHIVPILKGKARLVYNPFFIAMGTVMSDFLNPEFVLLGSDDTDALKVIADFYNRYYYRAQDKPIALRKDTAIVSMTIESAELTKVAYNTFISTKIAYANTLMELCHKIPNCNVDDVVGALSKATDRLMSPKYMFGGMGDGGGCHPRDNIAMSWLAKQVNLSHNIFDNIMMAREHQTEWLVDLLMSYNLPKVILGKSFKPETNIVTGSPAMLCANMLTERNVDFKMWDPYVDGDDFKIENPSVVLVGTKHRAFAVMSFPPGSVIIDPHRYIPKRAGIQVIHLGVS